MAAMNWLEIAAVCAELAHFEGAQVQGIHQPSPGALILDLRIPGANGLLLISAEDDLSRLHLIERRPPNPPKPFAFAMLNRSRILPSRLMALTSEAGERVVTLDFRTRNDETIRDYRLVAELTGRHANLFLLDADGVILGSLRPNHSQKRPLTTGQIYQPPAAHPYDKTPELRFDACDDAPFPANAGAAQHYGALSGGQSQDSRQHQAARTLRRLRKRNRRAIEAVKRDLATCERAPEWRKIGDLLQVHFHALKPGQREVILDDLIDGGEPLRVTLDPARSRGDNMAAYYAKAKKGERGQSSAAARLAELEAEGARLDDLATRMKSDDPEELEAVWAELGLDAASNISAKRRKPSERQPFRRFTSETGREIRVGRSGKDNDLLTFRLSRGDDFWLHASGYAGSHVVVPMARGAQLDPETLIDAATLAAHYSKARGGPVEVIYARVRKLKKAKNAPPGQVLLSGHKSLRVSAEPERIRRLMRGSELD